MAADPKSYLYQQYLEYKTRQKWRRRAVDVAIWVAGIGIIWLAQWLSSKPITW